MPATHTTRAGRREWRLARPGSLPPDRSGEAYLARARANRLQVEGAFGSSTSQRQVLVVEDEPISRHALVALCRAAGWTVADAGTLGEAIKALDAGNLVAIVLDLMIPGGNGVELLERIRREGLPIQVAVVTGVFDWQLLERVRAANPDRIFRKPVDFDELRAWLRGV